MGIHLCHSAHSSKWINIRYKCNDANVVRIYGLFTTFIERVWCIWLQIYVRRKIHFECDYGECVYVFTTFREQKKKQEKNTQNQNEEERRKKKRNIYILKDEENFLQNTHKTPEMRFFLFYALYYYVGR